MLKKLLLNAFSLTAPVATVFSPTIVASRETKNEEKQFNLEINGQKKYLIQKKKLLII
ncbi:hypothetical protein OF364_01110 [Mycoplasma enhydrae]|uniref:hypothetical protein n=1 Tax=Mycoplasma enhydrae TaxID=2499220 RepID=UPI0021E79393|nr:hypothetical protein [Mycoplasma enhydrae]MCV3753415.1 hypothetical protein [Mycoplasma enhydrae]